MKNALRGGSSTLSISCGKARRVFGWLSRRPDDTERLVAEGKRAEQAGDVALARAVYETARGLKAALKAHPDDAQARLALARALFDLANRQAARCELVPALDTYHRVLEYRPGDPAVLCNEGTTLKSLGRMADAIECYRRAVAAAPRFADAHYNLGVAYRDQGRSADAILAFRQAIEIRPQAKEAHLGLGHALRDLDRNAEALAAFQRVLELDPDDAMARWSIT